MEGWILKIQVLIATMNQTDHSLLKKMNIQTDAIVGNQCDNNSVDIFEYNGQRMMYYNFAERGVGLNRNNTLMRADADICLFADDDMTYVDNYAEIVKRAFLNNPTADIIVFNLIGRDTERDKILKKHTVHWYNYLKYGTARIAFRLASVKKNGIYFNQCFGGGTEHCHGEDNLFLTACLKNKLKLIAVPEYIAALTEERESSWNIGYNDKYLFDQGALYYALSKRYWKLLCFQDAVRHYKRYTRTAFKSFKLMLEGAKKFKGTK